MQQITTDEEGFGLLSGQFGRNNFSRQSNRIFERNGKVNVVQTHSKWQKFLFDIKDPFHALLNRSWFVIIFFICSLYLLSWALFAFLYYACDGTECLAGISNPGKPTLMEVFLFSVETQTTIGFGNFYPMNSYTQTIFVFQCLIGIILDGCLAGLVFSKFAMNKRNSAILFSDQAIIGKRNGVDVLTFRIANLRKHPMVDGRIRLYFAHAVDTLEGERYMQFDDMKVVTTGMVFFSGYPFVATHVIDDESPLRKNAHALETGEILVLFEAVDTATSNTIQARFSYKYSELCFGGRFANIVREDNRGRLEVDFSRFNDIEGSHTDIYQAV